MRNIINVMMVIIVTITMMNPIISNAEDINRVEKIVTKDNTPEMIWRKTFNEVSPIKDTATTQEGDIILVGGATGNIESIDTNGRVNWVNSYHSLGMGFNTVSIAQSGNIIAAGSEGKVVSIKSDGTLDWENNYYLTGSGYWQSSAVTETGDIILGASNGMVLSIKEDGTENWVDNGTLSIGSPADIASLSNGDIILAATNDGVVSLDASGNFNWQYDTSNSGTREVEILSDGTIITASSNHLYKYTPGGELIDDIVLYPDVEEITDMIYVSDDNIILICEDGKIASVTSAYEINWVKDYGNYYWSSGTMTQSGDLIVGEFSYTDARVARLGTTMKSIGNLAVQEESYEMPTSDNNFIEEILTAFEVEIPKADEVGNISYSDLSNDNLFSFGIDNDSDGVIDIYGKDGSDITGLNDIYKVIHTPGSYDFVFEYDYTSGVQSSVSTLEVSNVQNAINVNANNNAVLDESGVDDTYVVYVGDSVLSDIELANDYHVVVNGNDDYNSDGTAILYNPLTVDLVSWSPSGTYQTSDIGNHKVTFSYTDDDASNTVVSKEVTLVVEAPPFESSMMISETNSIANAQPGETLTNTISVVNGSSTQDINITDEITDANIDMTNLDLTNNNNITVKVDGVEVGFTNNSSVANKLDITVPSVSASSTLEIIFETEVMNPPTMNTVGSTNISNSAVISASGASRNVNADIEIDISDARVNSLSLEKTLLDINDDTTDTKVVPNDVVTYEVKVKNTGSMKQRGVVIEDTPDSMDTTGNISNVKVYTDSNMTNALVQTVDYDVVGNKVEINNQLDSLEELYITYDVTVGSSNWTNDDKVSNIVDAQSEYLEYTDVTEASKEVDKDRDVDQYEMEVSVDIVDNDGDNKASLSEPLTYKIRITNKGWDELTDVRVVDNFNDEYLDLANPSNTISYDVNPDVVDTDISDGLDVTYTSIMPCETREITVRVSAASMYTRMIKLYITNNVSVVSNEITSSVNGAARIRVDFSEATRDASLIKTVESTSDADMLIDSNEDIDYKIEYTNGSVEQNGAVITDIPDNNTDSVKVGDEIDSISNVEVKLGTSVLILNTDYEIVNNGDKSYSINMLRNIPANSTLEITYRVHTPNTLVDNDGMINDVSMTSQEIMASGNGEIETKVVTAKDVVNSNSLKVTSSVASRVVDTPNDIAISAEGLTYKIRIENDGSIEQRNVRVVDELNDVNLDLTNARVSYDVAPDVVDTDVSDGLDVTYTSLMPSEVREITIEVKAQSTFSSNVINNNVKVNSDYYDNAKTIEANASIMTYEASNDDIVIANPVVNSYDEEIAPVSESDMISAFGVSATDRITGNALVISVDASRVDYDHPGDYDVVFSSTDSMGSNISKSGTLSLQNIAPSINTNVDTVDVLLNDNEIDYVNVFAPSIAGETVLNSGVGISSNTCNVDSNGKYDTAGTCEVTFSINDDDSTNSQIDKVVSVNVKDPTPSMDISNMVVSFDEEITPLSDSDMISAFGVSAIDMNGNSLAVRVDASSVDYDHPGDYDVVFSSDDGLGHSVSKSGTLSLQNIAPSINTSVDTVDVLLNDNEIDYMNVFAPSIAGENVLNSGVGISSNTCNVDSNGKYDTAGTCEVTFSINDDDSANSQIDKVVSVNVKDPTPSMDISNMVVTFDEEITPLSDSDMISAFGVSAIDMNGNSLAVRVDASSVDYDHPGDYDVVFSSDDGLGHSVSNSGTLSLQNIAPSINTSVDTVDVLLNDNEIDYMNVFAPSIAGETVLNSGVSITSSNTCNVDSNGKYDTAGTCEVTFSINDDDTTNSQIDKVVSVNVNSELSISAKDVNITVDQANELSDEEEVIKLIGGEATAIDGRDITSEIEIESDGGLLEAASKGEVEGKESYEVEIKVEDNGYEKVASSKVSIEEEESQEIAVTGISIIMISMIIIMLIFIMLVKRRVK